MIDINTLFGFWPKKKADIALDTLLRLMDEKGIEKAFTLSATRAEVPEIADYHGAHGRA